MIYFFFRVRCLCPAPLTKVSSPLPSRLAQTHCMCQLIDPASEFPVVCSKVVRLFVDGHVKILALMGGWWIALA